MMVGTNKKYRLLLSVVFALFCFPSLSVAQDGTGEPNVIRLDDKLEVLDASEAMQTFEQPQEPAQDSQQLVQEIDINAPPATANSEPFAYSDDLTPAERLELAPMPSLFFTFWEMQAIEDAKASRGLVERATDAEIEQENSSLNDRQDLTVDIPKPEPGIRTISLGGILYSSAEKWVVWLNGRRITPTALPDEAISFWVTRDYVEVKWFDNYTNRIYPIRIRPHQRFDLDARIFLPG